MEHMKTGPGGTKSYKEKLVTFLEMQAFSSIQIFSCISSDGDDCDLCGSLDNPEPGLFAIVNCNYNRKAEFIKMQKPEGQVFSTKSQFCGLLVFGSECLILTKPEETGSKN